MSPFTRAFGLVVAIATGGSAHPNFASYEARLSGTLVAAVVAQHSIVIIADRRTIDTVLKKTTDSTTKILQVDPQTAMAETNTVGFGIGKTDFDTRGISLHILRTVLPEDDFSTLLTRFGNALTAALGRKAEGLVAPTDVNLPNVFLVIIVRWNRDSGKAEFGTIHVNIAATAFGAYTFSYEPRNESNLPYGYWGETAPLDALLSGDPRFAGERGIPGIGMILQPSWDNFPPQPLAVTAAKAILRATVKIGPELSPPIKSVSPTFDLAAISGCGFQWIQHNP